MIFQDCQCLECKEEDWLGDDFCDDHLNNENCLWDGGDCCFNNLSGWDSYCQACASIIDQIIVSFFKKI